MELFPLPKVRLLPRASLGPPILVRVLDICEQVWSDCSFRIGKEPFNHGSVQLIDKDHFWHVIFSVILHLAGRLQETTDGRYKLHATRCRAGKILHVFVLNNVDVSDLKLQPQWLASGKWCAVTFSIRKLRSVIGWRLFSQYSTPSCSSPPPHARPWMARKALTTAAAWRHGGTECASVCACLSVCTLWAAAILRGRDPGNVV